MGLKLLWRDDFAGPALDARWVGGHLNHSAELRLRLDQGLQFAFDFGKQYASAGVVLRAPVTGNFRAELRFTVQAPAPGTTFELAALQLPPPAATGLPPPQITEAHRVFDVHGAPPFVSSEFDEDDGWRISWNSGARQGGWNAQGNWQADNHDNEYPTPSGEHFDGPVTGWLALERQAGDWWVTSGRLDNGDPWKQTGKSKTPLLPGPVYLRIAAKHWVKKREHLTTAPANHITIRDFSLLTEGDPHALDGQ